LDRETTIQQKPTALRADSDMVLIIFRKAADGLSWTSSLTRRSFMRRLVLPRVKNIFAVFSAARAQSTEAGQAGGEIVQYAFL